MSVLSYSTDAMEFMMSPIDAVKLKSCMTLFDAVSPNDIFREFIDTFFGGKVAPRTLDLINSKEF